MRAIASIVLAALLLTGCQFSIDVGPPSTSQGADMTEWDLTERNDVEVIGWPADQQQADWQRTADQGLERILLPDGLVLEGFDRADASRRGGFDDVPLADEMYAMGVTYSNRPVAEIRDIAVGLAEEIGDDPTTYTDWAGRNRVGVDPSPDGNRGRGPSIPLGHLSITLQTRAVQGGRADLFVTLSWPDAGFPAEEAPTAART